MANTLLHKGPTTYILEAGIPKQLFHGLDTVYVVPEFFYQGRSIYLDRSIIDNNTLEVTSKCDVNISAQFITSKEYVSDSCGCNTGCKKKSCGC